MPLVVGSWRTCETSHEGAAFVSSLVPKLGEMRNRQVVIAPPFPALYETAVAASDSRIAVAAQDVSCDLVGAHTSAAHPRTLRAIGVRTVIVGRSTRHRHGNNDDAVMTTKVRVALDSRLLPIVSIGEDKAEHHDGLANWSLFRQVWAVLKAVHPYEADRLALAYEPRWASARGKILSLAIAQETARFIRCCVAEALGSQAADSIRVLHRVDINADDPEQLMRQPDIDGLLMSGDANLCVDSFAGVACSARNWNAV
jgi:triosephosphate isomerase